MTAMIGLALLLASGTAALQPGTALRATEDLIFDNPTSVSLLIALPGKDIPAGPDGKAARWCELLRRIPPKTRLTLRKGRLLRVERVAGDALKLERDLTLSCFVRRWQGEFWAVEREDASRLGAKRLADLTPLRAEASPPAG